MPKYDDNFISNSISSEISNLISSIEEPVTPDDIDTYGKYKDIENKSRKINTILRAWNAQQQQERDLRNSYAKTFIVIIVLQLAVINLVVVLVGLGCLFLPQWVFTTLVISVFGEISAMSMVIIKYLFPEMSNKLLDLLEKL
jgi:hypothetical protein